MNISFIIYSNKCSCVSLQLLGGSHGCRVEGISLGYPRREGCFVEPLPDTFHQIFLPSIAGKVISQLRLKEWLTSHNPSLWGIYLFILLRLFHFFIFLSSYLIFVFDGVE